MKKRQRLVTILDTITFVGGPDITSTLNMSRRLKYLSNSMMVLFF